MFGLSKPCKIRFYGDHRRDQIEKYKSIHISKFILKILFLSSLVLCWVAFIYVHISFPHLHTLWNDAFGPNFCIRQDFEF